MKVLKPRAALLSDFEVLKFLKDMEAEQKHRFQLARERRSSLGTIATDAQDSSSLTNPSNTVPEDEWLEHVPENLRTIQYETIAFLSQTSVPCAHQSEVAITSFLDILKAKGYYVTDSESRRGAVGLNKSERLQIVNHAPQSVVELHTLVEELSERLYEDQVSEILQLVETYISFSNSTKDSANVTGANGYGHESTQPSLTGYPEEDGRREFDVEAEEATYQEEAQMDDDDFVHEAFGEGGVEEADADD